MTKRIVINGTKVEAVFDAKGQMMNCTHWELISELIACGWVKAIHHMNGMNATTIVKA